MSWAQIAKQGAVVEKKRDEIKRQQALQLAQKIKDDEIYADNMKRANEYMEEYKFQEEKANARDFIKKNGIKVGDIYELTIRGDNTTFVVVSMSNSLPHIGVTTSSNWRISDYGRLGGYLIQFVHYSEFVPEAKRTIHRMPYTQANK